MKLLVTGREGQIVTSLLERAAADRSFEVVTAGRPEFDLARPETIRGHVARLKPDILVSAAAYTAVDQAEDEPDLAMAVNGVAPGILAEESAALGIPIIHLSTDYVFSGDKHRPYFETDEIGPNGVYGATKLAGEQAVVAANPCHVILRTAWVYSSFGKNFVKTMLRLAADRSVVSVVADQVGNPTSAHDIADGILAVASALRYGDDHFGVYHLAGTGTTSWAGFAAHVFEVSRGIGGPWAEVKEIATNDYPTKARRPANSRLSTAKLEAAFGWRAPDWRDSASFVVHRLVARLGKMGDAKTLDTEKTP